MTMNRGILNRNIKEWTRSMLATKDKEHKSELLELKITSKLFIFTYILDTFYRVESYISYKKIII